VPPDIVYLTGRDPGRVAAAAASLADRGLDVATGVVDVRDDIGVERFTARRPVAGCLRLGNDVAITPGSIEDRNRWMLRARDAIDRDYGRPLNIPALARIALVSEAHFIRTFRATFGETPHRYLQRRRVERAMALLRNTDRSVTDICFAVGFSSLGTFSRNFREIMGRSPSDFRQQAPKPYPVPTCFTMTWVRPSSFGEVAVRAPA
jgi:AraC-like DNA-binding protein